MKSEKTEKHTVRKLILLLILLLLGVFIFINKDSLQNKVKTDIYPNSDSATTTKISLLGDHTVTQRFTAKENLLSSVKLRFKNPGKDTASGTVRLTLLDSSDNKVAETKIRAGMIGHNKVTRFILGGDSEAANPNKIISIVGTSQKTSIIPVEKGKEYTLLLEAEGIESDKAFDLVLKTDEGFGSADGEYTAAVDGTEVSESWLSSVIYYRKLSTRLLILIAIMILATAVFVLLPFDKIDAKIPECSAWLSRLMLLATPVVSYFIIERFYNVTIDDFIVRFFSPIGALNLWILVSITMIIYMISNRARFTTVLSTVIAAIFGLTNYALILFRDTPLIATDFAVVQTALQVANSYEITWDKASLSALLIAVLWCVAACALGSHKGLSTRKRFAALALTAVCAGSCYYAIFASPLLQKMDIFVSGFSPKGSYERNGSTLSFAITLKNSRVVKPSGYDPDTVHAIMENYPSDEAVTASEVSEKTPNVIIIMNESFTDLSVYGDLGTNEDFMPFFRSLKENTIHGWMESSVFGGSTADSEFECLTGFTMNYLPFHSVPYRSVIRQEIPSLAYYFKSLGYGGISAFHPGMRDSYNRDKVYPLLGFDKHIALDDLKDPERIRDYVSDSYDYRILEEEYEQFRKSSGNQPFFCFNVTIQNHGAYTLSTGKVDHGITIDDEENNEETALQFVNLMKYSDDALEELIDYYSNIDEETVIMLFGDHHPKLNAEFYDVMREKNSDASGLEWATIRHSVPFMIWANYDIEEEEDVKISANYLSAYMKQAIGLPLTGFDKYLLEMHEELPVLSAISFHDSEGNIYDPAQTSAYDDKLSEYSIIQYNGLIDNRNRISDFFECKQ